MAASVRKGKPEITNAENKGNSQLPSHINEGCTSPTGIDVTVIQFIQFQTHVADFDFFNDKKLL